MKVKVKCKEYIKPSKYGNTSICESTFGCYDILKVNPLKDCKDGIVEIDWTTYIIRKEYLC